ncbi:MAG: hypothetical protein VR65_14880 [Desulfobulbaceae bacterium BRH_c16a]|nr:MAG: hypothetical protein VR65_14880 [Desulfobulbaceae bacterium BRH_c16a]
MKKIIASAVGLMLAGGIAATTASALENEFGGYWRTRLYLQDNFDGQDSGSIYLADSRTRLYYTAKFSDDFKFVNKFEFNTAWGDANGGDIGADGTSIWRIKNSYADFNVGTVNTKIGSQGAAVARGFIFDDDFSGVMVTPKFGNVSIPLVYMSVSNEDVTEFAGYGHKSKKEGIDENLWAALASINISDAIKVVPYFVYHEATGDFDNYYVGIDADMKMEAVTVWGTAIFNGGTIDDVDNMGFLVAAGADAGMVHGQAFYATGDDDATDGDNDQFISAPGSSYYWSEIMGYGAFDNRVSNGSLGDDITNVWAANAGVTIKPMDKLRIDADVWYASLAEENAAGDDELGVEFDGKLTYSIYDNLTAEAIFAYLIAGDATGDEDVLETGVRVSLKF